MTGPKPTLFIVDGSIAVTGALVSAARQAKLLAGEADTILVLPRGHQVPVARTAAFAKVIELPIVNLRKSLASAILYGPALIVASVMLRREMRRRGCERLQLNDFYLLQGAMLRLLGYRGRIVTFVRIDPTRFGAAGRLWLAAARRCSTEIVAVSRFIQRVLGPGTPARLIYEAVDLPPAQRGKPAERTLLFVGNLIEGKGQNDAIASFNRIAPFYPHARLRLVGGDMGLSKNKAFRARLVEMAHGGPAADRIEFCGPFDNLTDAYAGAFAVLNFSASESFSMTCLDASAAGLPLIATRCGGPEEIVEDDISGFLVPVGDVAAMAEKIAWLLNHPGEAAAMGAAGRLLVAKRFSTKQALLALSALLELPPRVA